LGLSVGLIVFIVSLTGTMYVFKDEIQNTFRKDAIWIKPETIMQSPIPIATLKEKVSLEVKEKFPISSVEIPLDKTNLMSFSIMKRIKKGGIIFKKLRSISLFTLISIQGRFWEFMTKNMTSSRF
jgi:hypothetical protein